MMLIHDINLDMNQTKIRDFERAENIPFQSTWTAKEDSLLSQIVSEQNAKNWRLIAELFSAQGKAKTAKQCRERWHTYLNPTITNTDWTKEEQLNLINLHKKLGNKWSTIAAKMPGRTDNAIKSWFFCQLRKVMRSVKNNSMNLNISEDSNLEETAYLLNYLYMYYISSERKENMQKIVQLMIIGRKNQGDKYILSMLESDSSIPDSFQKYVKSFIANTPPDIAKRLINEYPQLFTLEDSDLSNKDSSYGLSMQNEAVTDISKFITSL